MIRYRLLDTFEPGAVQVCVGIKFSVPEYVPIMRWALLQESPSGTAPWITVSIEPPAP
jgi:hypothetical protein